jgi:RHS repeat-associated protein
MTALSTYDANGNTLSDPSGKSYTWDFENRLTQAVVPGTNAGTTNFKYDPFGRRIQKSGPLGTTNYLYDGVDITSNVIEELDSSGNVLARYAQNLDMDQPLAEYRSGTISYYDQDAINTVTSLTNSSAAVANGYTFDSFGRPTSSTGALTNPFQYAGRDFDPETGLNYYRARYFDPTSGRFISEDPIGFLGSGPDFYQYVGNSPINFADPSGLCYDKRKCIEITREYLTKWQRVRSVDEESIERIKEWAATWVLVTGAEKFFEGPITIETGWTIIGKGAHKLGPWIHWYHYFKLMYELEEIAVKVHHEYNVIEEEYERQRTQWCE